jgi:hypothetical protein
MLNGKYSDIGYINRAQEKGGKIRDYEKQGNRRKEPKLK